MAVALSNAAVAVEPAEEFLQGLQERGHYELALVYLERMSTSQAVDDTFRSLIPYHRATLLLEQSRRTADAAARNRLLEQARTELERFAEANRESVQGAEAYLQLANVHVARGQQLLAEVRLLPAEDSYDEQRASVGREARGFFAKARETFQRAESIYSSELEKLPPTGGDGPASDSANRRQEYRARVAQLRFLIAQTQFETAQSYPPSASEHRKLHEAAAQELATIHDEFARHPPTALVGLFARLYEGRAYHALGQYQQAIGCFDQILELSNLLQPFRKLIASAVHRKAETLLAQEKFDAAIEACRACLRNAKGTEAKQAEWLAVRFRLAESLERKAAQLAAGSLEKRKLTAEARDAYRPVANVSGEFQVAARTALAALVRGNGLEKDSPRTFQAAYDLGKGAIASYNAAKLAISAAERNSPEAVPELQEQMEQGKEDARRYFLAATSLVEDDTDPKLLTEVRYFLCWLYWEAGDYYRAAVLGEFLARRFPDHPAAASAAKISMASYERLYHQAAGAAGQGPDAEFEARRMARIAEFVVRRWPGSQDADAAQSVLVSYAIRTNRIDEAEQLLAGASPRSRSQLELQLGNAMWAKYLELSQGDESTRPDAATLTKMKQSAMKFLRSGLEASRKERELSEGAATAALYLAQLLLSEEQYGEAVELLEDKQAGPLALIERKHSVASRPHFAVEAYKAALRGYVLMTPPQADKALMVMRSMEASLKESGANSDQITQIYIGLGVTLQKQLEELRDSGRTGDAERVAASFGQFLDRIAKRQADVTWPVRVWLAQTYYNLGTSGTTRTASSPAPASDAAREHLTKARDAYRQLLEDVAKNPQLAPNETARLAVKMQLGECYRALGQFKQALDTFSDILKERESSLAVQRAAAYTYQERGQAEDAQWLERAIQGGYQLRSTGQNRIWGWAKLSQVAARAARTDEKHLDAFYEARINIARCRYLIALKRDGSSRQQDLAKAKQSIQSLAQLYPDLGGERWRGEFDTLMKQIQTAAGEKPDGLREFSAGPRPQNNPTRRRS